MRQVLFAVALILLTVAGAGTGQAAERPVQGPVAFRPVSAGPTVASVSRNAVYLSRRRSGVALWGYFLARAERIKALAQVDFKAVGLVALFYDRNDPSAVTITQAAISGETLNLSIRVVPQPIPIFVCESPCVPAPSCPAPVARPDLGVYDVIAVDQVALRRVNRVIVIAEEHVPPPTVRIC